MNTEKKFASEPNADGKKKDIFDRIMSLPLLRLLYPFYYKHKAVLLYLFFGFVTTVISWVSFWVCDTALNMHELVANLISWFLAVLVAFITNRIWVFDSRTSGFLGLVKQIFLFYMSRIATFLFESAIIFIFVTVLDFSSMPVKIIASVFVVVLNYFLSKIVVFRKKKNADTRNGIDT